MATFESRCLHAIRGVLRTCSADEWFSGTAHPGLLAGVVAATLAVIALGLFGWRHVAGQFGRRAWRNPRTPTAMGFAPRAASATQGADIHLVMNAFNRLAGEPRFEDPAALDPIFLLSDYLRQCMTHSGAMQVALHDEIELLQTYLRLAAGFHGQDVQTSVTLAPGSRHTLVQAHSLCLATQMLIAALPPGPPEPPHGNRLQIQLSGLSGSGVDAVLALTLPAQALATHEKRIRADAYRLCDNMSLRDVIWTCRVVKEGPGNIELHLRIRSKAHLQAGHESHELHELQVPAVPPRSSKTPQDAHEALSLR